MTATDLVLTERRDHVLLLTMNRPAQRNAFDNPMYRAMTEALEAARADDAVRVVVVTGAGDAFCAGQDFAEMSAAAGTAHGFPAFLETLIDFDKPLLAAVNGAGVGLGLTMLLHTDIAYMADNARLKAPFVTLGVVPEAAASYLLPIVVGAQRAAELLYTARWIDAAESVALGLAYAAVPRNQLLDVAFAKAAEIAANPPAAIRYTKRLLRVWRRDAIVAARAREDAAFTALLGTPENLEAIQAFFERRPPKFG